MSKEPIKLQVHTYGDNEVKEYENMPVPMFLKVAYLLILIVGSVGLWAFWNGSTGYFDRGYWKELQIVAGTTRDAAGNEIYRPTE